MIYDTYMTLALTIRLFLFISKNKHFSYLVEGFFSKIGIAFKFESKIKN